MKYASIFIGLTNAVQHVFFPNTQGELTYGCHVTKKKLSFVVFHDDPPTFLES